MPRTMRLDVGLVTCLAAFAGMADAFWRLPCRGRSGLARLDPLMDPGKPSYHVHAVHGSGGFSMDADSSDLKESDCTSCAVTQDKSAYWAPALYFMHENGDTEIVEQVGGMLAYYLLYGENVTAFPDNFQMIAGDTFKRDFQWPIPDPPKSEWNGKQASQAALRQKALGFNCLNYNKAAEPSLGRHFMPNKTFLDEHCTDGVRVEIMFPSCWNGKDVTSDDHQSHVAYPSLVMDGTCPEGFETRVVSLFFETIWDTYAFKNKQGTFVFANGDPTGFGYHADFMHGWESGVLESAVERCTNPSGQIQDCDVFDIQSDAKQQQCTFDIPSELKGEKLKKNKGSLPNNIAVEYGPAYASPVSYVGATKASATGGVSAEASVGVSIDLGALAGNLGLTSSSSSTSTTTAAPTTVAATSTSSTSTFTPYPTTSVIQGAVNAAVVYVEQEIILYVDEEGHRLETESGTQEILSTATTTITRPVSTAVSTVTEAPVKRSGHHHRRHHGHGHH